MEAGAGRRRRWSLSWSPGGQHDGARQRRGGKSVPGKSRTVAAAAAAAAAGVGCCCACADAEQNLKVASGAVAAAAAGHGTVHVPER